jgi:hypothetical protein
MNAKTEQLSFLAQPIYAMPNSATSNQKMLRKIFTLVATSNLRTLPKLLTMATQMHSLMYLTLMVSLILKLRKF